jgi:biotin carboxylase
MHRVLLLLPTSTYRAGDFLKAAATMDVEVVVASERRQALAGLMGDRALSIPLRHPAAAADAICQLAARRPLDAVVAVDDQGVLVAALAAARLGLPHNPPAAVAATRDKLMMRRALARAGVRQPAFRALGADEDAAAVAAEVGLPCVVKPLSLSASRGVIRADDLAALAASATRVRAILAEAGEDAGAPMLVEAFVPGPELAVEATLTAGALEVLAVFDKPDAPDGPYFEETLYVTPSRQPPDRLAAVEAATAAAAAAIGLTEGPVHAELRLDRSQPVLLELAARSIGGLCSRSLRFGRTASLEERILRQALGLPLGDLVREQAAAGVMMLPIPRAGTLERVAGQEAARAVAGIVGLDIAVAPGRRLRPLPEGDRYLGFLFARADSPAEVEQALRTASGLLDVVIS